MPTNINYKSVLKYLKTCKWPNTPNVLIEFLPEKKTEKLR